MIAAHVHHAVQILRVMAQRHVLHVHVPQCSTTVCVLRRFSPHISEGLGFRTRWSAVHLLPQSTHQTPTSVVNRARPTLCRGTLWPASLPTLSSRQQRCARQHECSLMSTVVGQEGEPHCK